MNDRPLVWSDANQDNSTVLVDKRAATRAWNFCGEMCHAFHYRGAMDRALAILLMLASAVPAGAMAGQPPIPIAQGSWVTPNDWTCAPDSCDTEGTVRFALTVSVAGRVKQCAIVESSGNAILDELTCRLLIRRARFEPARDDDGQPVEAAWGSRISWKIPDAPAAGESPAT